MRRLSLSFLILAAFPVACATNSLTPAHSDLIDGSWPIGNFDGFDPYPVGAPGDINAYVNFARDGILRTSLGCKPSGAPYRIDEDNTLTLLPPSGIPETDYQDTACSNDLISKEKELVSFLESSPRIGATPLGHLVLKSGRKTLLLQPIFDVLDEDTKMKVEL